MYVKFKSRISYLISNLLGREFGKIEIKKKSIFLRNAKKGGEKNGGRAGQEKGGTGL